MAFGDRRVEDGKAGLNRTLKKNTKEQLNKALSGNVVSDREVQSFEDKSRAAADAGLRSQQAALNQQAAAAGEGSVQAQVLTDAAQKAQKQSADSAIAATGQAEAYREGATASRKAAATTQAMGERDEQTRRRQQAMANAFKAADLFGGLMGKL